MNIQFPRLLRPFWGKVIWRKDPSSKVVYITFDDGPVPEVTIPVLNILAEYGIKATFFCVGDNVKKYPDTYAQMLCQGHAVGNHTFHHLKGYSVTNNEYFENIKLASKYIQSNLFRPPHGHIRFSQIKEIQKNFQIIMWDLITHDYNSSLSPNTILKTIKKYTKNGSIVVFHDSLKAKNNVLQVLPQAIAYWKSEGYEFGVL